MKHVKTCCKASTHTHTHSKIAVLAFFMMSLMLITTNPLSAQWMDGGNTFTAPGGCVKAQFGTLTSDCDIQFITNSIERMRLTSNGNFGIGTTTPMRIFHVNGNIRFENLPMDTRSTAIMIDANGDLSTRVLQITNWNTAFSWGNHDTVGYLMEETDPLWLASPSFEITGTNITNWNNAYTWGNHDTVGYLIEETDPLWSASPSFEITGTNITNWNNAYTWGNHDTVGYLLEEFDPQWIADSANYYTKSNLQVDGQSQVHYENLTNVPTDLSDFTDTTNSLFDGDWSSLSGDVPDLEIFSNNAGYITSPDDADADSTNELQTLNLNASETALTLSDGGAVPLNALNYWTKEESNDDLHYEHGNVGIGITTPQQRLHIHSDTRSAPFDDSYDVELVDLRYNNNNRPSYARPAITALQITNAESGTSQNDGLQFRLSDNNAVIYHREAGDLTMLNTINGNKLKLKQNGSLSIGTNTQSHLFVSESGNVGIGTDAPEEQLDINGNVRIKGVNSLLQLENKHTEHKWELYSGGSVGNNGLGIFDRTVGRYLIAFAENGNVGIGTVSPEAKLYVAGNSNFEGNAIFNQYVGIGTASPQSELDVRGEAHFYRVKVQAPSDYPDYVFNDNYELMSIAELELFITMNKHLPGIPTEEEVAENGVDLGEMNKKLLQKVEELSLYIIEQEKRIQVLENAQKTLKEDE